MNFRKRLLKLVFFCLVIHISVPAFGEDTTPAPYEQDEFPVFLKDLRRFEIITLGAMPFVTLDTSLAYSSIRYVQHDFDSAYTPNIFSSSSFDTQEQVGIVLTSLGICVGIGITDYVVRLIKRTSGKRKSIRDEKNIKIIPISQDPSASQIPPPPNTDSGEADEAESLDISDEDVIEVEE